MPNPNWPDYGDSPNFLTQTQIAQYAQNAGFTGNDLITAIGIVGAESSNDANVLGDRTGGVNSYNGYNAVGLFQINVAKNPSYTIAGLLDPQANANAAYAIYKQNGNSFKGRWTTYDTGAYLKHPPPGSLIAVIAASSNSSPAPITTASTSPNGYVYGYKGPPFNFLGHFCTTQYNAFQSYVNSHIVDFSAIQIHYQIRAAQLRKTAGALGQYYSTINNEVLLPTFNKNPWRPGPEGWFGYLNRNDQLPMVVMDSIKEYMKDRLQRQDEGVFSMNHIRNVIEKTEDKAQRSSEATADIPTLFSKINALFNQPEYEAVLVKDQSNVYPAGSSQPAFRVHQLDAPTQREREQSAHQLTPGGPTNIKETGQ